MPPIRRASQPAAASGRTGRLDRLLRAVSPASGSRRDAAAAPQAITATADQRRAAAAWTAATPQLRRTAASAEQAGRAPRPVAGHPW